MTSQELTAALRERLGQFKNQPAVNAVGSVISSADGIATVSDMTGVRSGELISFASGAYGIAMNLEENKVGVAVFYGHAGICSGESAAGTGRVMEMPCGRAMLGRVVNPLGAPLDGKGEIKCAAYRPIEFPAPGIIERGPVNRRLETGILAIDSMIPIGRGQRELIIGDREIGKTSIAVDTILNQKGKGMVCIYVAIGQQAQRVARTVQTLQKNGAMEYTTVVCASASDTASMQYICPYAACALGEYFMYNGMDALIVYDDLSKHAVSYRTLSLLLHRPPGREAYPGDVFYLHSRLLERAAQLSPEAGGGSLTALPIVETMNGDISAYIPTNVISITDGQIFLDAEKFRSGARPAINTGLSVSRVGGAAQGRCVRKLSGRMRLELAQYQELVVFARFGSDLEPATVAALRRGERLSEALKQGQHEHYTYAQEALLLYALSGELLKELKPAEIQAFFKAYLDRIYRMHPEVPYEITHEDKISDASKEIIDEAARAVLAEWEEAARESSEAAAQSENAQGENAQDENAQSEAALKSAEVSEAAEK